MVRGIQAGNAGGVGRQDCVDLPPKGLSLRVSAVLSFGLRVSLSIPAPSFLKDFSILVRLLLVTKFCFFF